MSRIDFVSHDAEKNIDMKKGDCCIKGTWPVSAYSSAGCSEIKGEVLQAAGMPTGNTDLLKIALNLSKTRG